MENVLSAVINHSEVKSLIKSAFESLSWAKNDEVKVARAEGMAAAAALLTESPFGETVTAVNFLWWLHENPEKAKELWV